MISLPTNSQVAAPHLLVTNVHAAYVKKEILRGVTLTVGYGEIVALLGGNGSGKSTLLKTIAGLLHPVQGCITFDAQDITPLSVYNRQKRGIGYLLQGGRVFPNLTARENFEAALRHHRNRRSGANTTLGSIFPTLQDKAAIRAGLLSGGQRQMLAIEMVLAQEPDLTLLDEPTGALSPDLAGTILQTISAHAQRTGCSVLLVEQNVSEAKAISHRYLHLEEGQIIEQSLQLNRR